MYFSIFFWKHSGQYIFALKIGIWYCSQDYLGYSLGQVSLTSGAHWEPGHSSGRRAHKASLGSYIQLPFWKKLGICRRLKRQLDSAHGKHQQIFLENMLLHKLCGKCEDSPLLAAIFKLSYAGLNLMGFFQLLNIDRIMMASNHVLQLSFIN